MSEFPEGFKWNEAEGRPVFTPPPMTVEDIEKQLRVLVPSLDRAEELLWQAGHPRIAEQLHSEVAQLMRQARALFGDAA
jgi:hypothetical protein